MRRSPSPDPMVDVEVSSTASSSKTHHEEHMSEIPKDDILTSLRVGKNLKAFIDFTKLRFAEPSEELTNRQFIILTLRENIYENIIRNFFIPDELKKQTPSTKETLEKLYKIFGIQDKKQAFLRNMMHQLSAIHGTIVATTTKEITKERGVLQKQHTVYLYYVSRGLLPICAHTSTENFFKKRTDIHGDHDHLDYPPGIDPKEYPFMTNNDVPNAEDTEESVESQLLREVLKQVDSMRMMYTGKRIMVSHNASEQSIGRLFVYDGDYIHVIKTDGTYNPTPKNPYLHRYVVDSILYAVAYFKFSCHRSSHGSTAIPDPEIPNDFCMEIILRDPLNSIHSPDSFFDGVRSCPQMTISGLSKKLNTTLFWTNEAPLTPIIPMDSEIRLPRGFPPTVLDGINFSKRNCGNFYLVVGKSSKSRNSGSRSSEIPGYYTAKLDTMTKYGITLDGGFLDVYRSCIDFAEKKKQKITINGNYIGYSLSYDDCFGKNKEDIMKRLRNITDSVASTITNPMRNPIDPPRNSQRRVFYKLCAILKNLSYKYNNNQLANRIDEKELHGTFMYIFGKAFTELSTENGEYFSFCIMEFVRNFFEKIDPNVGGEVNINIGKKENVSTIKYGIKDKDPKISAYKHKAGESSEDESCSRTLVHLPIYSESIHSSNGYIEIRKGRYPEDESYVDIFTFIPDGSELHYNGSGLYKEGYNPEKLINIFINMIHWASTANPKAPVTYEFCDVIDGSIDSLKKSKYEMLARLSIFKNYTFGSGDGRGTLASIYVSEKKSIYFADQSDLENLVNLDTKVKMKTVIREDVANRINSIQEGAYDEASKMEDDDLVKYLGTNIIDSGIDNLVKRYYIYVDKEGRTPEGFMKEIEKTINRNSTRRIIDYVPVASKTGEKFSWTNRNHSNLSLKNDYVWYEAWGEEIFTEMIVDKTITYKYGKSFEKDFIYLLLIELLPEVCDIFHRATDPFKNGENQKIFFNRISQFIEEKIRFKKHPISKKGSIYDWIKKSDNLTVLLHAGANYIPKMKDDVQN